MKGLTTKQKDILDFIRRFISTEGMAPTVYEIASFFDIKTSTVFAHIKSLQKKQYLNRSSKARSIALTDKKPVRAKNAKERGSILVPLLSCFDGDLAAAMERAETVACAPDLLRNGGERLFVMAVEGDSMRELGIIDGDQVIVDLDRKPVSGDIVVALANGVASVRSCFPDNDAVELRPANADYVSQFHQANQLKLLGVVIGLQREYR